MSDKAVDGSEVSQARDNEEENMKSGSDASPEPEEVIEEGDTTSVQAPSVEQLQVDDELDSIKEGVKRPHALAENGDHPHRKRKKAQRLPTSRNLRSHFATPLLGEVKTRAPLELCPQHLLIQIPTKK